MSNRKIFIQVVLLLCLVAGSYAATVAVFPVIIEISKKFTTVS